jgi:hypothetical protein
MAQSMDTKLCFSEKYFYDYNLATNRSHGFQSAFIYDRRNNIIILLIFVLPLPPGYFGSVTSQASSYPTR